MVMGYVPGATVRATFTVIELVVVASKGMAAGLGTNETLMPEGIPVAVSWTFPANWFRLVSVAVAFPDWLALMESVLGATAIEKSGTGSRVSVAVFVTVPNVAESVAVVEEVTTLVETEKVALVWPAGIVTLAGTTAALLSEARVITVPPLGAGSEMVTVPMAGFPPMKELGATVKESSSGPVSVRESEALWTSVPLVPVIVIGYVPGTADRLPVIVATAVAELLADKVTLIGLKFRVTPLGRVADERTTVPAKSLILVTVTVAVPTPL
jgi:hypothetical protein